MTSAHNIVWVLVGDILGGEADLVIIIVIVFIIVTIFLTLECPEGRESPTLFLAITLKV